MILLSEICVNSQWVASFLAAEGQECCECGMCKVRVKDNRGYKYIVTEEEMERLEAQASKEIAG